MTDRQRRSKRDRQEEIIAELRASPTLRVSELATELAVSTETIRRDLDDLQSRGLIDRTYGGAARPLAGEPAIAERHRLMVHEREAMALAVAQLIRPQEVVAIGGGATTLHVARRMAAECRHVKVITHSYGVATVLAANPTIQVVLCPGRYNGLEGCVVGGPTLEFVQSYYANRAILGATGLTAEGISDANDEAAAVYRAFMNRAGETIIVADHSKFEKQGLAIWGRWSDVTRLVCDQKPTGTLARALDRASVEVIASDTRIRGTL